MYKEKEITKLTLEVGDVTTSWEVPYSDSNMDQLVTAFYSLCIGQTYLPQTVLKGMQEFVEDNQPEEGEPHP